TKATERTVSAVESAAAAAWALPTPAAADAAPATAAPAAAMAPPAPVEDACDPAREAAAAPPDESATGWIVPATTTGFACSFRLQPASATSATARAASTGVGFILGPGNCRRRAAIRATNTSSPPRDSAGNLHAARRLSRAAAPSVRALQLGHPARLDVLGD